MAAVPKATPVTAFSSARMNRFQRGVIAEVGEETFNCWFTAVEMERLENGKLTVSVPVMFLKRGIDAHYDRELLRGAQRAYASVHSAEIVVRKIGTPPLGSASVGA